MWPIFKALVTGGKALVGVSRTDGAEQVMEVARGVGGWIDEQQFTPEEKAKYMADVAGRVAEFVSATVGENSQRSITRRSIAIWIMRAEVGLIVWAGVSWKIDREWADYLVGLADFNSPLGWIALGVAVFFFGSHLLRTT